MREISGKITLRLLMITKVIDDDQKIEDKYSVDKNENNRLLKTMVYRKNCEKISIYFLCMFV